MDCYSQHGWVQFIFWKKANPCYWVQRKSAQKELLNGTRVDILYIIQFISDNIKYFYK